MKAKYYTGTIVHKNGEKRTARLRETMNFWMESKAQWWRKTDGTLSGSELEYPKLMVDTVQRIIEVRGATHKTTHFGHVIKAKGGAGTNRPIRETKFDWVDSEGKRFKKADNGWSTDQTEKLDLTSIEALPKQPRKSSK
jgi:hypothetical protein